jgi:hypothetical protein
MALNCNPPISLHQIFFEIYGRNPNIGESFSLDSLVQASNLADKSLPHDMLMFLCYTHAIPVISGNWYATLSEVVVNSHDRNAPARRALKRDNGQNSIIIVDTAGAQTNTVFSMYREGAHFLIGVNRFSYIDHNGFIFDTIDGVNYTSAEPIPLPNGSNGENGEKSIHRNGVVEHPVISKRIFVLTRNGKLYVSWGQTGGSPNPHPSGREFLLARTLPESSNSTYYDATAVTRLPDNSRYFIAGANATGNGFIERSSGEPAPTGITWTRYTIPSGYGSKVNGVIFTNNTQGLYYGKGSALGVTNDSGATWDHNWYWDGTGNSDYKVGDKFGNVVIFAGNSPSGKVLLRMITMPTDGTRPQSITIMQVDGDPIGVPVNIRAVDQFDWLITIQVALPYGYYKTELYRCTDSQYGIWSKVDLGTTEDIWDVLPLAKIPVASALPIVHPSMVFVSEDNDNYIVRYQFNAVKDGAPHVVSGGQTITIESRVKGSNGTWTILPQYLISSGASSYTSSDIYFAKGTTSYIVELQITATNANATPDTTSATKTIPAKAAVTYLYAGDISYGYSTSSEACQNGPTNPGISVYSENGTIGVGARIYYNSSGTSQVGTSYYYDGSGWIYVNNGLIEDKGNCNIIV